MTEALRVGKMLYGGTAIVSSQSGQPAPTGNLPFVLPDELLQRDASGTLRIIEPSPDRVAPSCIHFGECGGCHYQHAAYPAQLSIKQAILSDLLVSAGLAELPIIEAHSAEPWHYRNRIRLRIGKVDGELRLGYNRHSAAGGEPPLPITMCPISAPILWRGASTLLERARSEPAIHTWLASATELELFINAEETALQLTLFIRSVPSASFATFCALAQQGVPQLVSAGVAILPRKPSPQGRRFERSKPGAQWGAPGLVYKVQDDSGKVQDDSGKVQDDSGRRVEENNYWVGRGAFFQVNRHLVSTLAQLATANRSGTIAWDFYAGVGLFSRALTRTFAQVSGVEPAEPAASALAAVLKMPHRAFAMTALDFLQAAVVQRERPDLIVMDPPRAGVGPEVCALLARVRAPELVYVSCDPVTLARDLQLLTSSGYKITALHLVDMFPQTFHLETIAILHR